MLHPPFASPVEILLVEDNPGDARLVREMLAEVTGLDWRLEVSPSLADALGHLESRPVHVVVLDLMLPDSRGLDTFCQIQTRARDVPVVVLTGMNDEDTALAAVQLGAQDYLLKGQVDSSLLGRALHYAIERKRLLRQVEADRSWLSSVIDRAPVGILVLEGADGARAVANQRARELLRLSLDRSGLLVEYASEFCGPEGSALSPEDLPSTRALRGDTMLGEEFLARRPDGVEVPVAVYASQIRGASEIVLGAVVMFEDMSALRELERVREEWMAVIAHDLRQPVTVIKAYAELLAREAGPEVASSTRQRVEHIRASAAQLNRLTTDLLDVSRLEAGRLNLQLQPTHLPTLVQQVLERTEASASRRVQLAIPPHLPRVQADPGRIEQVLSNLLSNAIRYGYPDTEVLVELELLDDHVEVAVTNRGQGLGPEELPALFSRFHRSEQARASRPEGLGLGLYISKGLVEAHQGRIWVESSPGETTVFRFTLPVEAALSRPCISNSQGRPG